MLRLSLLLIFLNVFYGAQEKSDSQIYRAFLHNHITTHKSGKFEEGIVQAQKLIKQSERINYTVGVATGYLDIANYLASMNRHKEALKYLEIAEKLINSVNNDKLKMQLYNEYASTYDYLGIYDIAFNYYDKAIVIGKQGKLNHFKKVVLGFAYTNKAVIFGHQDKVDSAYIYHLKSYKVSRDPIAASNLAFIFLEFKKKEIDSAAHYLKIASDSLKLYTYSPYDKLIVLKRYGDYFSETKEYHKALEYYHSSLQIGRYHKEFDNMKDIYKSISEVYAALKNNDKSTEYFLKYSKLSDSLNSADKQALNISVNKLMKEKETEKKEIKSRSYFTLFLISFATIVIIILGYHFYFKKKKEKDRLILNQQQVIIQKDSEKRKLEHKVNDAFDEVIRLARKNDPAFLARFKEVYPEFCENILKKYPGMINSELTFCAYLKLNFSTKEIANYTFVTPKAIEIRKSRFRKKMGISTKEDIYIWINKI